MLAVDASYNSLLTCRTDCINQANLLMYMCLFMTVLNMLLAID